MSLNYGNKFFSNDAAKLIGFIREDLEKRHNSKSKRESISDAEYNILLASLLYSFDKIANTVGHYEAYRKNTKVRCDRRTG